MRRSRAMLLGLATVGCAAAMGLAYHWRNSVPTVPSTHRVATELHERGKPFAQDRANSSGQVAAELAKFNAELSALRDRIATREERGVAVEAPSSAEEIEDTMETSRLRWQEHMAQVEEKFKRERVDPTWARETSRLIERELAAEPSLRASVRSMECRAQSCRLELNESEATSGDGAEHALPLLLHRLGTTLPVAQSDLVDTGNGKMVRVVFLLTESES